MRVDRQRLLRLIIIREALENSECKNKVLFRSNTCEEFEQLRGE